MREFYSGKKIGMTRLPDEKGNMRAVTLIRLEKGGELNLFAPGQKTQVQGISKGKGFQGAIKRWGFAKSPKTHGTEHTLRAPGSIGSMFPQRVLKGKKMAGHMGHRRRSVKGLRVVAVDKDKRLIALRGAVPGPRKGEVKILQI